MVKKVFSRLLCLSVIVGTVGMVAPAPVIAQTASEPTCEQDASVDPNCAVAFTDSEIVERDPSAPEGTRCYSRVHRRLAESLIGLDLWAYFQRIQWCVGGGKITSTHRSRWAEVYAPGWQFQSHIGSDTSGGRGSRSYTAFTQGKFRLCLVYCVQSPTPWIRQTGRADGSYSATAGG